MRWALTLSERYCRLYVADDGDDRLFHWEERRGDLIGMLRLSPTHRLCWREQRMALSER